MKFVLLTLLFVVTTSANAAGVRKVEPGMPTINEDGTVSLEARVTDENGQSEECVFTMAVERVVKDGIPTIKLVEKGSNCIPIKS